MNDWLLLQEYIADRSEKAFAELVHRHLGMVYGTALRKVREPQAAQDVAQAVFILLARKAGSLSSSVVLGGWLHRTAGLLSLKLLRDEQRRKTREKESSIMPDFHDSQDARLWEQIAPQLDDALAQLSEPDRNSIILRFIEQRSFREVSEALRISEDAAKKRVSRALEKLRSAISARGVAVPCAALAALLASNSQAVAPGILESLCIRNALTTGPITSSSVEALLRGFVSHSSRTALKWAVSIAVLTILTFLGADSLTKFSKAKGNWPAAAAPAPAPMGAEQNALAATLEPAATEIVTNNLILRVQRAEDRTVIPNAEVYYVIRHEPSYRATVHTDAEGVVRIALPAADKFPGMSVWVGAADRVPLSMSWARHEALSLPREYTVELAAGHRLSGRVVNEQGNGVGGAKLRFNGEGIEWNRRESVSYVTEVSRPVTDAQGYWEGRFFPAHLEWVAGRIEHPDYAITTFSKQMKVTDTEAPVFTLQRGVAVTGVVKDPSGAPIAEAKIELQDLSGWRDQRRVSSDAEGRFEIDRIADGKFALRLNAADFQPESVMLTLGSSGTNVNVALQPVLRAGDAILRGRVIDHLGRPMYYVSVRHVTTNRSEPSWSTEVDTQGRFEWLHAPEGIVKLSVSAGEYGAQMVELAADGSEHEIRFGAKPMIHLRGKVVDAKTGAAVPRAKLMLQATPSVQDSGRPDWLGEAYGGSFVFAVELNKIVPKAGQPFFPHHRLSASSNAVLFVDAPNYRRTTIELARQTNDIEITIELQAGGPVQGQVLLFANHQPASDAELAFGTKTQRASMEKPGEFAKSYEPNVATRARTAHDGTFDLGDAPFNADRVLVVHEQGWANVAIDDVSSDPIILQAWGRVEGVIRIPKRDGETRQVTIRNVGMNPERMGYTFYAEPDAAGRFVFEKVPSGEAQVSLMHRRSQIGVFSHSETLTVRASESTNIVVAGSGVRVRGRVVFSKASNDIDWSRSAQHLQLKQQPPLGYEFGASPQAYGFFCDPDGSFIVEAVLPGEYRLMLSAVAKQDRVDRLGNVMQNHLGRLMKDVTVGSEEVSLGELTVELDARAQ